MSGGGTSLPDAWGSSQLGDLAEIVGGSQPKVKEAAHWSGAIPFIAISDLGRMEKVEVSGGTRTLSEQGVEACGARLVSTGAVLMASIGATVGKVAIAGRPLVISPNMMAFEPGSSIESRFLYWWFRANTEFVRSMTDGSAQPFISRSTAKGIRVPVPPIEEQRRIVQAMEQLFADIEEGEESLSRSIEAIDAFRASVLRAALRGELPSLSEDLARQLREAQLSPLSEHAAIRYGWTASASDEPVGPRMLRITDIQGGNVDWDRVPYCEIPDNRKADFLLDAGHIVFARTGATTGKSYLIPEEIPESVFASYLIRVSASEDLDPEFLYLFFQSADYWAHIQRSSRGIGQPNVNAKLLGQLEVPVPPIEAQTAAVAIAEKALASARASEDALMAIGAGAEALRTRVLSAAFLGKLAPSAEETSPNASPDHNPRS